MRMTVRQLILVSLPLFLGVIPVLAGQNTTTQALFEDASRVDSMIKQITPDRLEELRRRAQSEAEPRNWYDLGAALLLTGDWEGAVEPLQRAASAADRRVDEPAAYNLGVAYGLGGQPINARAGQSSRDRRRRILLQAQAAFRRVLRGNPEAEDARWNLEVVDRWLEQLGGGAGGGGGGGGTGGGGGGDGQPMTRAEADRLLDAVAAEERRVQEDRLERNRQRDPVAERNW